MIQLLIKRTIEFKKIYFAQSPTLRVGLNCEFLQTAETRSKFGFKKVPKFTKTIDLTKELEEIFNSFDKRTKYEIKRAEKENYEFLPNYPDLDHYVEFYNDFARLKGEVKQVQKEFMIRNSESLFISACRFGEQIYVMHSYVVDKEKGRAALYHSASHFRSQENVRAIIGRANRFLHFSDIRYFKENGFTVYDIGGYSTKTSDDSLMKINRFKDSFRGQLVKEYNYIPFAKYAIQRALKFLR